MILLFVSFVALPRPKRINNRLSPLLPCRALRAASPSQCW